MTVFSKASKPDNSESHNSLKLIYTNIQALPSNFVDCESFLESNSPDDSIGSGNFSVGGFLRLI